MLQIEGVGLRAYSAANSVNGNQLTFIIKVVPGGKVSNLLAQGNLQKITVDGPYGTSYLHQGDEQGSVFIAGGSGIAPMLSMVGTLLEQCYKKPIKVFYGSRLEQELIIAKKLFKSASNLQLVNVLSNADEDSCWEGEKGFVHEVLERYIDDFKGCEFYLCGPPPMITATQKVLMLENKVPFEQIHFDRFF
jgi:toluene monooxygenase electron transfer component